MFKFLVLLAVISVAFSFQLKMKAETPLFKKYVTGAMASIFAASSIAMPANALTKSENLALSYEQVKGSGLANRCSEVKSGESIGLQGGRKYKVFNLCLEPTSWQVEEEVAIKKGVPVKEFVNTKLMTRQTYSLDGVSGTMTVKDGKATFTEEDGIDYSATTVQLPGGERVPFLFSVKNLVATSTTAKIEPGFSLSGSFTVPSYRTGLFLDPKGRGTTTGYDFAGGLAALQTGEEEAELFKENNKKFDVLKGDIEFAVTSVNAEEGEFGGVFVSKQPSDTDMGAKEPKTILSKGIFYGQIDKENFYGQME